LIKPNNTIIIGSGLGGLICGVILSRKGYKVTVLEKNRQIGGSLQSFIYKGHDFSTGMHYVGSLDEGQTLNSIFKYLNLFDGISYKRLDEECFDLFNIGGKEYCFPMGFENFRKKMYEYFPDEKEAIDLYVDEILDTIKSQDIYLLKSSEATNDVQKNSLEVNTWDFICSITENETLRNVLTALNFVYAGEKDSSPLYVHALINNHFISSSYRIYGSTSRIADKLANEIIENGGEVLTKKKAVKILTEDKKVTSIETEDNSIYYCDSVISDVHPSSTMDLIPEGGIKTSFRRRMKRKKNTISAFAVHIVLKENTFRYINTNYNYYKGTDTWYASSYDEKKWPEHYFLYCSVPENGSEFSNSIGLLTHMKFDEVEQWKDSQVNRRGDEYKKFKTQKAEQLIELVTEKFPELKGNIVSYNVSTPLTYNDYLGTPKGSMYGTMRDYKNPVGSYISPTTKVDNLYFTGQNINLHGILGVSLSAFMTCGEFMNINDILKEINESK